MELMSLITLLLFFHWIADFVVQSRSQAEGKSDSLQLLGVHCFTYTVTLTIGLVISMLIVGIVFSMPYQFSCIQLGLFFSLILFFHFLIDFITSKITKYFYMEGRTKLFWMIIGFDQWLHVVQILIIYFIAM